MYSDKYTELYHHGVKGQHWGERRWQNEDGSLTPAGYAHYGYKGKNIRIAANSKIYRRSLTPTADDMRGKVSPMYVSTTKEDDNTWGKFFKPYYGKEQKKTKWKVKRDLNVADQDTLAEATKDALHVAEKTGTRKEAINELIKQSKVQTKRIEEAYYSRTGTKIKLNSNAVLGAQIISRLGDTEESQMVQHQLVKRGKDALIDVWGLDVAQNPVVILNPKDKKDTKVKLTISSLLKSDNTKAFVYTQYYNENTKRSRRTAKERIAKYL